jgi:hypothetical protein
VKWVLSIDPGKSLGWALWRKNDDQRTLFLISAGVITGVGLSTKIAWVNDVIDKFTDWYKSELQGIHISEVVIEEITFWGTSARSHAAAVLGHSILTAYLIGELRFFLKGKGCQITMIDVREWKGQMNDVALSKAIHRIMKGMQEEPSPGEVCKQHKREAVGIGLWYGGLL